VRSTCRVACVRIPRFPIGAVWRAARRDAGSPFHAQRGVVHGTTATASAAEAAQLLLGMEAAPAPPLGSTAPRLGAPPRQQHRPTAPASRHPSPADDAGTSPRPTTPLLPLAPAPAPAPAHWDEQLVALTDGEGAQARLRAVSAAAGRAGVRAGMRVSEARARCAALEVLPWDDTIVARAVTEMSALLLEASPQVTPVAGAPGLWWVGASGFDTLGGDRQLAYALLRIARRWHPRPRVSVADSCVAARAATWAGASFERAADDRTLVAIVPAGRDARYLSSVPLALVPMDDELRDALRALGVRTAGELAALTAEDVERRWGATGMSAWRLARGDDPRRPGLLRRDAVPAVDVELPAAVETMEPVLFLVRAALDRLARALASRGRAAAAVAITLTLDTVGPGWGQSGVRVDARKSLSHADGMADPHPHTVTREVRPARPTARATTLFERCRALLDGWTLTAPVRAVSVSVPATAPLPGDQGDLLDTTWKDAAALEAALARLRAELGPRVVVRPVATDTHRVEARGAWVEADVGEAGSGKRGADAAPAPPVSHPQLPTLAFRLLTPPEPALVELDGETPVALTWRERRLAIAQALGPERLSGDWWRDAYSRDYWRCTTADGELLLFRDRTASDPSAGSGQGGWQVQGWYD